MAKIFENGSKAVNVDIDTYNEISDIAKEKKLYPSQVVNQMLKKSLQNLKKGVKCEQ